MSLSSRAAEVLPAGRRARFILPALIVAFTVVALLTPAEGTNSIGDTRLSSFLSGPNGAKGLFEVSRRLGWRVERQTSRSADSTSTEKILAILAPPEELSEQETGAVLRYVRRGGSLLTIVTRGSAMEDSLQLHPARLTSLPVNLAKKPQCPANEPRSVYQMLGNAGMTLPFSEISRIPAGATGFISSRNEFNPNLTRLSAIGFPFGAGRIVALSDPNLLRNDYIRVCSWGIGTSAITMLDYLSAGRARQHTRLVFDEVHQGFGPKPNIPRAIRNVLFHTAPGAMLFQIIVASGILLLAIAPRAILPPATARVQRRSPFEHVEALSSAYRQIGATRVVTQRLVRGLRRRLSSGYQTSPSSRNSDAAFLESVSIAHPKVSNEVATIAAALTQQSSPAQLVAVGAAIQTIERTIKR